MLQTRNMAANEDTSQSQVPDARREMTLVGESCPNCGMRIQRRDLYKHFAACPKRQYTCDFCNFGSTYDVVLNHWQNECNRYPVQCPYNCRLEPIERQNLEEHAKECPLANSMVDCEYSAAGCKARPLRKDMQLHLRENVVEHLALVAENQRQANSGIELNYQELQMTALKKKQDEQQGRLEQTEKTLGDVDYKVSCKVPQQIQKLQEQCAKLGRKQEDLQNTASYQASMANRKVVQVKEELSAAIARQGHEMAQHGQQLEESTVVQQQQVAELRQELQENSEGVEEQITELKREDKTVREKMAQDKDELMAVIVQEKQALKDEVIDTLTKEIQELKDRLDAVSRENQALRRENAKFDQSIAKLTNELHQANESSENQLLEMQQSQDQKMLQLQKEHNQDISLIRRAMITSVRIPCEQTMTNFEDRKSSNNPWYSEPFTTPALDYKFCLVIFANGSGPSEGTHVSIFVHLMEGPAGDTVWPPGGEVVVTLVNQLGDRGSIPVNIPLSCEVPNPTQRRTPGIDLVSHQKLRNRTADIAYLQNDRLRLQITDFRAPNPLGASRRGWFWS